MEPRKKYGGISSCARCGQDIQWLGKTHGWRDRGNNRSCVSWHDREGEIVLPKPRDKHKPA